MVIRYYKALQGMALLLLPFLGGKIKTERSDLSKQLGDNKKKSTISAESQHTIHLLILPPLLAAVIRYLILAFEILAF